MKASQFAVHVTWALTLANARAFISSPVALRSLRRGHAATATMHHVARRSASWGTATRVVPTSGWANVGIPVGTQTPMRSRHMRQPVLFMSSAEGMNPESFTERAWDAMAKLPALADANKAQVMHYQHYERAARPASRMSRTKASALFVLNLHVEMLKQSGLRSSIYLLVSWYLGPNLNRTWTHTIPQHAG